MLAQSSMWIHHSWNGWFFWNFQWIINYCFVIYMCGDMAKMMMSVRCSFAVWKRYQLFIPAAVKIVSHLKQWILRPTSFHSDPFKWSFIFTQPHSRNHSFSLGHIQVINDRPIYIEPNLIANYRWWGCTHISSEGGTYFPLTLFTVQPKISVLWHISLGTTEVVIDH